MSCTSHKEITLSQLQAQKKYFISLKNGLRPMPIILGKNALTKDTLYLKRKKRLHAIPIHQIARITYKKFNLTKTGITIGLATAAAVLLIQDTQETTVTEILVPN